MWMNANPVLAAMEPPALMVSTHFLVFVFQATLERSVKKVRKKSEMYFKSSPVLMKSSVWICQPSSGEAEFICLLLFTCSCISLSFFPHPADNSWKEVLVIDKLFRCCKTIPFEFWFSLVVCVRDWAAVMRLNTHPASHWASRAWNLLSFFICLWLTAFGEDLWSLKYRGKCQSS